MAKPINARHADLAGAPPKLATLDDLERSTAAKPSRKYAVSRSSKMPMRMNLRAVAEALIAEGLDPAIEMIKILKKEIPVLDSNGKPKIDPKTKKPLMVPALDDDTKLRTLNELLQYTQPKLKSVEMKVSGNLELTNEQLDDRLVSLLAKAAKR